MVEDEESFSDPLSYLLTKEGYDVVVAKHQFRANSRAQILGELDSLILPHVNTDCMQIFLNEVSARHLEERIVMVIDGAGWHRSDALIAPTNICLLKLPPYAPELNPIEHVWDELREKFFHNRVFRSLDALESHLASALRTLELDPNTVGSIVSWPWIISAFINSFMN